MNERQHPDGGDDAVNRWFKIAMVLFFVVPACALVGISVHRHSASTHQQESYSAALAGRCFRTAAGDVGVARGGHGASGTVDLIIGDARVIYPKDSVSEIPCAPAADR